MAITAEQARHIKKLEEELAEAENELFEQWLTWHRAIVEGHDGYQKVAIDAKQKADMWEAKADELRGRIAALKA